MEACKIAHLLVEHLRDPTFLFCLADVKWLDFSIRRHYIVAARASETERSNVCSQGKVQPVTSSIGEQVYSLLVQAGNMKRGAQDHC